MVEFTVKFMWMLKMKNYLADIFLHNDIEKSKIQKKRKSKIADTKLISEINVFSSGKTNRLKDLFIRQSIRERGTENYRLLGETPAAVKTQLSFPISDIKLWDLETPVLYEVKTELLQNGNILDEDVTLFGFRTAVFLKDGFY